MYAKLSHLCRSSVTEPQSAAGTHRSLRRPGIKTAIDHILTKDVVTATFARLHALCKPPSSIAPFYQELTQHTTDKDGHAVIKVAGNGAKSVAQAARGVYLHKIGHIPAHATVTHLCKNKACMYVAHMHAEPRSINRSRA